MAKGYTSKTELENYLLQTIDETFDTQVTKWIESIEAFIEKYTGRIWVADTEESERVYDGDGSQVLLIDDCLDISKIEIDDEEIDELDSNGDPNYYLYPANQDVKNKIKLVGDFFVSGNQNVAITAKWGSSEECPEDITLATTILVAGIMNYSNSAKGKIVSKSIGRVSFTYDNDKGWQDFDRAKSILEMNKKYSF